VRPDTVVGPVPGIPLTPPEQSQQGNVWLPSHGLLSAEFSELGSEATCLALNPGSSTYKLGGLGCASESCL
jgi:hypothetical protein